MTILKWEDPGEPTRSNSPVVTEELMRELKGNPNKWAVIHFSHRADSAANWNKRHKKDGFEFTSRKQSESDEPDDMKRYKVFARYNPTLKQTPPQAD